MPVPIIDTEYQLSDNLTATKGRIFLTGTQALLRVLLAQKRRDQKLGLNTAGFVTGYRGSPLGGVDMTMWRNKALLEQHAIRFLPAINEDLAATIVMGTQHAGVRDDRNVDGVFSMWYGKGPGVDRAGDALHHGNAAGASAHGGVLLIVGDDHTAASSSIPHASEQSLSAWRIPIVHPASIEEYELFGLWGWALSRYTGSWVAFKAITETVESGRSFELLPVPDFSINDIDPHDHRLQYSARDFLSPAIEHRMIARLDAVQSFSRRHSIDRIVDPAPDAKLGIITTGKACLDAIDALDDLRSGTQTPAMPALRHYKIGLSWPIDTAGFQQFAQGLDHILVIEEKTALIEQQVKDLLFNDPHRPSVCGKHDLDHRNLIPGSGQLDPDLVGRALGRWLHQTIGVTLPTVTARSDSATASRHNNQVSLSGHPPPADHAVVDNTVTETIEIRRQSDNKSLTRRPYFCSGCPHSTSTRVPEGSEALGGVGCHYMASWMDRSTSGLTQMGGEGSDWIGLSAYTNRDHIFQNMGEGTYFHSGYLAIRQAIAAKVNITYKILFNDAVAMTGGQPVDGPISVPRICQQLRGEGVERIAITSDAPDKYKNVDLVPGVTVDHRRELDRIQRELRDIKGVTVLIHDQECAAEKRRRRKQKTFPDPDKRLFINTAVCEGCGDCGMQSNCLSLIPVETPFGRKRAIDQSSCNKDYSCVDGFCPSFVSVIGGTPRHHHADQTGHDHAHIQALISQLPPPTFSAHKKTCNILVVGVGGTGVVTVGAIITMAAHLEGRAASVLDITGLAQKGGTVISHIRVSEGSEPSGAVRIHAAQADVAILCDPVAGATQQALSTLKHGTTHTAINTWLAPTTEFTRDPDVDMNPASLIHTIQTSAGSDNTWLLDAHGTALQHFGDGILSNMLMLGFTWQRGGIPVSEAAIMRALELNDVAVATNQDAFRLGRLAACHPDALSPQPSQSTQATVVHAPEPLEQTIERCEKSLTAYQNRQYAQKYLDVVRTVQIAERSLRPGSKPILTAKVAQALHKLMAYKDEYEVARLFTNGEFRNTLNEQFEGDFTLKFHLAPPLLARRDPVSGKPQKMEFEPWLEKAFRVLAHGKHVRGTWLDVFSYTRERRMERRLIRDYCHAIQTMITHLSDHNFALALELADLPLQVRGFGHVKERNVAEFDQRLALIVMSLQNNDGVQHHLFHRHA